jgi:D-3-phosphoglycerate dehydrogenase / 2-oxoglutarate reductase
MSRINVQEMENVIFEGAEAAIAQIHLEREPSAHMLEELLKANKDILEMNVIPVTAG